MKKITGYLLGYINTADKRILFLSTLFIAFAIYCNYHFGWNEIIAGYSTINKYLTWYFIFLTAFSFPYVLQEKFKYRGIFHNKRFLQVLLIAPALFAWKMVFDIHISFSGNSLKDMFWNQVFYWPFKLIVLTILLFIIWKLYDKEQPFYGINLKGFNPSPYVIMLLIMVPLVAAASTQADFLHMYPKLKNISYLSGHYHHSGWYKLLYELSYGSDFFSIELFFRGFLVLAFIKWVGKDAILPMSCFYCTIHFGKPLGECISSFFGGLILGAVTYNTRSIFGGLIVHLGIAWLMELGGYLGNSWHLDIH